MRRAGEGRTLQSRARVLGANVRAAVRAAVWSALLVGPLDAQRRVVAELPFEVDRHRAIIPVQVGAGKPLRLILDTGMPYDGILLFDSARVDLSGFPNLVRAQIGGAGGGAPSQALTDSAGLFSVGGVRFDRQRVIILLSDAMRGSSTDGVIGYSLLGHYAVELDYDRRRLVLYEPTRFVPDSSWRSVPLRFKENRVPWVDLAVSTAGEAPASLDAYLDCAAGGALELLQRPRNKFVMPATADEVIAGRGLSGDVRGRTARIATLRLGPYALRDVAALVVPAELRSRQPGADAVIGNDILRRFNLVFDYAHERLHLRPNRTFAEPFR